MFLRPLLHWAPLIWGTRYGNDVVTGAPGEKWDWGPIGDFFLPLLVPSVVRNPHFKYFLGGSPGDHRVIPMPQGKNLNGDQSDFFFAEFFGAFSFPIFQLKVCF